MTDTIELTQNKINAAMTASIEGFAFLVADSLEFELSRNLTDEEYLLVYQQLETAISSATSEGGAA